MSTTIWIKRTA